MYGHVVQGVISGETEIEILEILVFGKILEWLRFGAFNLCFDAKVYFSGKETTTKRICI